MATTSTDIYEISKLNEDIQKRYMPISDDNIYMGIYGYLNEQFSEQMQSANIMAIEEGNEAIPINAKYEKNLLTYAVQYGIDNINATPAHMEVMVGFIEKDIQKQFTQNGTNTLTIDKDCKIMIEGLEYHLDYDLIIQQRIIPGNGTAYTAKYDISENNPLSDITNPFIEAPVIIDKDNIRFIFIHCIIRQVAQDKIEQRIYSTNILENKTFDFEFDDQLASFQITSTEGDTLVNLLPIFEGMPLRNTTEKYCFYSYLDANHIRIKFDRTSYEPKLNYNISINLKTTKGTEGNFMYDKESFFPTSLESDKINYNGLSMILRFITDSIDGTDRKSDEEIKEILPKQILARDVITTNKDIENFFNSLSPFDDKLYFFKRRDNQIERLYYAYMLFKDQNNNIIPTNTINLEVKEQEFESNKDARYAFSMKQLFKYDPDNQIASIDHDSLTPEQITQMESDGFLYSVPFTCVINKTPLSISYYLNNFSKTYYLKYPYINLDADVQFIATSIQLRRMSLESDDYVFTMDIQQNIGTDNNLVIKDPQTNQIIQCNIKPFLVMNNINESYYIEGNIISANTDLHTYTVEFRLHTDCIIDKDNKIRIDGLKLSGLNDQEATYAYILQELNMSMYIFAKFNTEEGRNDSDIVFGVNQNVGYTLCNKFDFAEPVRVLYNFSNIIQSTVLVDTLDDGEYKFTVKHIPVVKYSYIQDIDRYMYLLEYLQFRKAFIDSSLDILENSFCVDLKFFNTYGKSRLFTIGRRNQETLDKPNLTLHFDLKLNPGADSYSKDFITDEVKTYVENINNNITFIHMSNLCTDIKNKFDADIEYFEFTGVNKYDSLYQYIEKHDIDDVETVPEFLNINLIDNVTPDIDITIV